MRDSLTKLFGSHLVNLSMLPDDAVVIDAGACVGNFIKDIQKHVKNPFVYAMEPSKSNLPELSKLIESGSILVGAFAFVGEKEPKEMQFREILDRPEWGNVNGLYAPRKSISYMVKTLNLEELMDVIPFETIHFLKMDIEGSEWDVVNDMNSESFERIQQISMEIHCHRMDITKKLEDIGYTTYYENGELYGVR